MAIIVERTDTFEEWRLKTNLISSTADAASNIGNLQQLVTVTKSNIVAAINETETSANITGGKATFTGNVGIGAVSSSSRFLISDSEKGMTIYGAGSASIPYALYAIGGQTAVLGQTLGSNSAIRGYNSTTNSNGYLGHQYYGVHGVGPTQGVGAGQSVGIAGLTLGSGNAAIFGQNQTTTAYGYVGISGFGVQGYGASQNVGSGGSIGVYGQASGTGNIGVYGYNPDGFGGYFVGNVYANDNVFVGTAISGPKFSVRGGNVLFSSSGQQSLVRIDNTETSNAIATTCLSLRFTDLGNVTANIDSAFLACTDSANIGGSIVRLVIRPSGTVLNATGTYGTYSDRRVKENIVDASPKLDNVMQLRVRNFNFTNDTLKQIGFVAQEMEEVFPGLVEIGENNLKSVKTSILIPILVKALQELTIQVDDLKYELNLLKANIS